MSVTNQTRRRVSVVGLFVLVLTFASSVCWTGVAARAFDDDKAQTEALKALEGTWVTKENEGIDAKFTFTAQV